MSGGPGDLAILVPHAIAPARSARPASRGAFRVLRGLTAEEQARLAGRAGIAASAVLFAALTGFGAVWGGHAQAWAGRGGDVRHAVANAFGFRVERVTVSGHVALDEPAVLALAGLDGRTSLPFLDVDAVRARLEANPLIGRARVSKFYPDALAIEITERRPFALWQSEGQIHVVAHDGVALEPFVDQRLGHLPLVVGNGANTRVAEYLALLEPHKALAARVRAGILVAGRRWTLKLDNGVDVRLPEDDAAAALARLVTLEAQSRVLDKAVVAVDLRQPDRVVVRLTPDGAQALEARRALPKKGGNA